jgi:hypothetical protein
MTEDGDSHTHGYYKLSAKPPPKRKRKIVARLRTTAYQELVSIRQIDWSSIRVKPSKRLGQRTTAKVYDRGLDRGSEGHVAAEDVALVV